jgi:integrase
MTWAHVEWNNGERKGYGFIYVPPEHDKAKNGYRVPISPRCYEVLKRRHANRQHDYVAAGHQGRPVVDRDVVSVAIIQACARAGLPHPDSPCHHMRRSFGRWAVQGDLSGAPVPLAVVSRWLGHSSIKTTMLYLDVTDDDSTRFMLGPAWDTQPVANGQS